MTEEIAERVLKKRTKKEMSRKGRRKRGNSPEVIRAALVLKNMKSPVCEHCGSTQNVHLHHIDGNWRNNDITNFQFLCLPHHLQIHGGNFKNPPMFNINLGHNMSEMSKKNHSNIPKTISDDAPESVVSRIYNSEVFIDFTNYNGLDVPIRNGYETRKFHTGIPGHILNREEFSDFFFGPTSKMDEVYALLRNRPHETPIVGAPARSGKSHFITYKFPLELRNKFGMKWNILFAPDETALTSVKVGMSLSDDIILVDDLDQLVLKTAFPDDNRVVVYVTTFAQMVVNSRRDVNPNTGEEIIGSSELETAFARLKKAEEDGIVIFDEIQYAPRCSGTESNVHDRRVTRRTDTGNPSGPDSAEIIPKIFEICRDIGIPRIGFTATERRSAYNILNPVGDRRVEYEYISMEITKHDLMGVCSSLDVGYVISDTENKEEVFNVFDMIDDLERKKEKFIEGELGLFLKRVMGTWTRIATQQLRSSEFNQFIPLLIEWAEKKYGNIDGMIGYTTAGKAGFYDPSHPDACTDDTGPFNVRNNNNLGWVTWKDTPTVKAHTELFKLAEDNKHPLRYVVFIDKGATGSLFRNLTSEISLKPFSATAKRSDVEHPNPRLRLSATSKNGGNALKKNFERVTETDIQRLLRAGDSMETTNILYDIINMITAGENMNKIIAKIILNTFTLAVSRNGDYGYEASGLLPLIAEHHMPTTGEVIRLVEAMMHASGKYELQ